MAAVDPGALRFNISGICLDIQGLVAHDVTEKETRRYGSKLIGSLHVLSLSQHLLADLPGKQILTSYHIFCVIS